MSATVITNDSLFETIQAQRAEIEQLTARLAELERSDLARVAKERDELREQNRRQTRTILSLHQQISELHITRPVEAVPAAATGGDSNGK